MNGIDPRHASLEAVVLALIHVRDQEIPKLLRKTRWSESKFVSGFAYHHLEETLKHKRMVPC